MKLIFYSNISGNLRPICAVLTHHTCKLLIPLIKLYFPNPKKRLRLPLVDFIGLRSLFMVKNKHCQGGKQEVAEIYVLNDSNNRTYKPSYW